MLVELQISNFAIVEQQTISFKPGLNVISGETGSGKSVVLQAIELVLGGRPKSKMVRAGADAWEVSALFSLAGLDSAQRALLPEIVTGGSDDADELLVYRTMNAAGKGRVMVNGRLATIGLLEEITAKLINVCGQGNHMLLLDPAYQLTLVDGYANLGQALSEYRLAFHSWKSAAKALKDAEVRRARNLLRESELRALVEELSAIELHDGLRAALEDIVRRAGQQAAAVQLGSGLRSMFTADKGLYDIFSRLRRGLQELGLEAQSLEQYSSLLFESEASLELVEKGISNHLDSTIVDDQELEQARETLALVAKLERKYRTDCSGLCLLLKEAEQELLTLDTDSRFSVKREEVAKLYTEADRQAEQISESRAKAAKTLADEVKKELTELSMPDAVLFPNQCKGDLGENGKDSFEFLIATNKGEAPEALRKIASGGELSRITLVLKKILRDRSGVNVLVFDEVDTGISGKVARAVGEKLAQLAENSQVLCITHLAQVASLAHSHFLVSKHSKERTLSVVKELSVDERVDEVARMLSGMTVTEASRVSARELMGIA
jgi:DNA repair protein RecN (Recombination protein N)